MPGHLYNTGTQHARVSAMPTVRGGTAGLLREAQRGNQKALNAFFEVELPPLRRWAQQVVPRWLHAKADPDDIVQLAAMRTLRRLHHLDPERAHSVRSYMRQVVVNLIRDEVRREGRLPEWGEFHDDVAVDRVRQEDRLFARATLRSYREALSRLAPTHRACVTARVERGWSYETIAQELGKPSAGAARVAVTRALGALGKEMRSNRSTAR